METKLGGSCLFPPLVHQNVELFAAGTPILNSKHRMFRPGVFVGAATGTGQTLFDHPRDNLGAVLFGPNRLARFGNTPQENGMGDAPLSRVVEF